MPGVLRIDGLSAFGLKSWRLGAAPAPLPFVMDGAETDRAEKNATGSPGFGSMPLRAGGGPDEGPPLGRCGCAWLGVCGGFGVGAEELRVLGAAVTGTTISSGWPSSGTAKSASSKSVYCQ